MRRATRKEKKEKTATYNLTRAQLNALIDSEINDRIQKAKEEATEQAVNTAMTLLLTLPMEVLMDHFWPKSYYKKIPEFTNYVLEYYEKWQNGEIDMDKLREDLWEYGGVKLMEE